MREATARIGIAIAACAGFSLLTGAAAVAQPWPAKSIRMISPFPPGGGIDASARIISRALSEQLGQQVIVDNRPGAGGRIGTEMASKAAPDGYTLLLGSIAPNAIIPSSAPNLPYDAIKDFAPVSLVGTTDYTLVVHPSLPVHSVRALIRLAKAKPQQLTFGSSGKLTASHLCGELLNLLANVQTTHVAYRGTSLAATAVLSGEIVMLFGSGPSVAPHVNAKRLRALATTGKKRHNSNLPLMSETLPDFEVSQWYGVLAPNGTAWPIIDLLHKEIARAVENPKVAQQFAKLGADAVSASPQEFSALIRSDIAKWSKIIKGAKITVE
jgi:tripartite-type tricarboxylate transporter receptor subunit TctC